KSWYVWARTLRIAERRNAERLCVGIMTLTLGSDHLCTREGSADQHPPGATSQRATPRQASRRERQQRHPPPRGYSEERSEPADTAWKRTPRPAAIRQPKSGS